MNFETLDLLNKQAHEESRSGHFAEAARLFQQIAQFQPLQEKRSLFYLLAASEHLRDAAYDEAIKNCRSAIAMDPISAIAWRRLGKALKCAGRTAEAEAALVKSISLSETPGAYIYLGCLCIQQGRFTDGEKFLRSALKLRPDFDEAHYNLGCALREQGRLVDAMESFQAAIQLSPEYGEAHRELGELLLRASRINEALMHLQKSLEVSPDDGRTVEILDRLNRDQNADY